MSLELEAGNGVILDDTVSGKVIAKRKALIAQVSVTHPVAPDLVQLTLTGTGDPDLSPVTYESSYVDVLNGYQPIANADGAFTILPDGRVQINYAGWVVVSGFADVKHTNNNAHVGAAFSIERNAARILSSRAVHARLPNAGNIGNISGVGSLLAEAGDIIGIALASDVSGTVEIRSSTLVFDWKGE